MTIDSRNGARSWIAVQQRRPDAGTWCEPWTVRDPVAAAGEEVPADTDVGRTGRTMKVPWFAQHMREELVPHRWDITGDDAAAQTQLAQPWMTTHRVIAVAARWACRRRGPATLETDASARVLLLRARRPADPARICSRAGPEALGQVRRLRSGY